MAHTRERVLERRGDVDGRRRAGEEEASATEAELDGKCAAGYYDTTGLKHHGTSSECNGKFLESELMRRKGR